MKHTSVIVFFLLLLAVSPCRGIELNVDRAVEIALENSEQMKIAQNSVTQAALNKKVAFAAYLPNFTGSLTGAWSLPDHNSDMGINLRMRGMYMAGINLTQPLFAGGKIVAANKMASIGKDVAREQLRKARIDVTANAMTAYWTYVAVLAKKQMMDSYRALVDTSYNQTLASLNAGMATRNQLLRIEARRSQVIYQQEQVANGAELCRMALCNALGIADDTPVEVSVEEIQEDVPVDLDFYNIESRPEWQMLKANVALREQQVKSVRADYLPTLGMQAGWSAFGNLKLDMMMPQDDGSYMPLSQKIHSMGWNIMLSLQIPIFHWGEGYHKVKHAKMEVENARLNLEHNTRNLNLQVQQAITNVRTGRELVNTALVAVEQARASLESSSQSYNLGMATITELLDAQAQWHTSQANLIEARTQLRINIVDYRAATATL